jgi:allantoicase
MSKTPLPDASNFIDLAAERLGGKALLCSDDFFAEKENLLKPGRGIFIPDKYTDRGKWMDGWESRRKRTAGHDWCIIQLATSGKIYKVDIDTNHFLGNHPPFASIEALNVMTAPFTEFENATWTEILPKSALQAGSQNIFEIKDHNTFTHLRLNIYPDGGVARLKVYGEVVKDWSLVDKNGMIDLAAAINGARSIVCNDMFFSHMENLIMPGRGINMGDGWETKRNRTPGNKDWVIVKLAHKGTIEKICIDTCHFKGNYPDRFMLEGFLAKENIESFPADLPWETIIPETKLEADQEHEFESEIRNGGPFTHVRLTIFPDGGISRMRCWGKINK